MKTKWILWIATFAAQYALKAQWAEAGMVSPLNANGFIYDIEFSEINGRLYAGGAFKNSANKNEVAFLSNTDKWNLLYASNGSLQANNSIYCIATAPNGDVYVGGLIQEVSDYVIGHYSLSANTWSILGNKGFNGYIRSMVVDASGNLYAAGSFKNNQNQYYVAKWDGNSFSELGTGTNALNPNGEFKCLALDNAGNVYAAGFFTTAPGKYNVMKWDGNSWSAVGVLNANNYINDIVSDAAGNLYAGGGFIAQGGISYIAKWDGTAWTSPGNSPVNSYVFDLEVDNQNNLYVGGAFKNSSGNWYVAKWDGSSWTELGGNNSLAANNNIYAIEIDNDGNVYAAGHFTNANGFYYVAKYTAPVVSDNSLQPLQKITPYPNPFNDFILLKFDDKTASENYNLEVTDCTGRVVFQQRVSDTAEYRINTQQWNLGIYFVRVISDNGQGQCFIIAK